MLGDSKEKWSLRKKTKDVDNWKRCFHCRGFKRNDQGEFTDPEEVEAQILMLFASGNFFPIELFEHFNMTEKQRERIREKIQISREADGKNDRQPQEKLRQSSAKKKKSAKRGSSSRS